MIDRFVQNRKRGAGEGGFTLIELLVVIVILGILAAVVVFSVAGLNDRGQESACEIDERTVRTAQEAHFATGDGAGTYAADTAELAADGFLSGESELHTTAANNAATPSPTYTITPIGACASTTTTT